MNNLGSILEKAQIQPSVRAERECITGGPTTAALCELAAAGLVRMFDPEKQIFCETYLRTENGMKREGVSHRYTMMTLLGLARYERFGHRSPIAIAPVFDALVHDITWINTAGDLGLLIWSCAELSPERLPELYKRIDARGALARFGDGRRGSTFELAWYLTGLASCYLAGHSDLPGLSEQTAATRGILEANCGPSGVYGHLSRGSSWAGRFRGRIGSFADQVYPTIAFARLSQALQDSKARQLALRTASRMCELQGSKGEWSWHYDSVTGRVFSRYPVFSVHQHAMGPMMLFAASEATGRDFSDAIYKGLAWINNNELGQDFIEPSLGLVWRCIYLDRWDASTDAALRFIQLRKGFISADRLNVRYECRPYELGWLLYAFGDKCFR